MTEHEHTFHPDTIDEQLEDLQHASTVSHTSSFQPDERMVRHLDHLYHTDREADDASLAHVWTQISQRLNHPYTENSDDKKPLIPIQTQPGGYNAMEKSLSRSRHRKTFEILAAVLIVCILVGSLLVLTHILYNNRPTTQPIHNISTPSPQATSAPISNTCDSTTATLPTAQGTYVEVNATLSKLDRQTGRTLWTYHPEVNDLPHHPVSGLTIVGKTIYFSTADGAFYALDAENGHKLWKQSWPLPPAPDKGFPIYPYTNSSPFIACDTLSLITADGNLRVLQSSDGHELWHKDVQSFVSTSSQWFIVPVIHNNVIYIGSSIDRSIHAFHLHDGSEIWHTNPISANSGYSIPLISNDVLYTTMFQNNNNTSALNSFSMADGHQILHDWPSHLPNSAPILGYVLNSTVYAIAQQSTAPYAISLYAFNIQQPQSAPLWHVDGLTAGGYLLSNQTFYITQQHGNAYTTSALDAFTGHVLWSYPSVFLRLAAITDTLYTQGSNADGTPQYVAIATNGHKRWSLTPSNHATFLLSNGLQPRPFLISDTGNTFTITSLKPNDGTQLWQQQLDKFPLTPIPNPNQYPHATGGGLPVSITVIN